MSDRPVFIPSRKRKKKQFFHGAFTGGFSAGHYNTVGSEEGWRPRQDDDDGIVRKERRDQRPEDFMDEQDHNEWGGPTSVREEYAASNSTNNSMGTSTRTSVRTTALLDPMLDLVKPPAQNVGHRLLRILGWRDGSTTAYVPRDADNKVDDAGVLLNPSEKSIESFLSSKRLKKIQFQQGRIKLPPPKLDTCGLGYDFFQNAPEFRAHRERRRKEAQERARAVTSSSFGATNNSNVYRLSNLLDNDQVDEAQQPQKRRHANDLQDEHDDDPLVSYETEQSFVGTKTVGGFALHEDDDDVYDDNVKGAKMNPDEYDNVVFEHASDVEDEHDTFNGTTARTGPTATEEAEFGSIFASYATSKGTSSQAWTGRGITSDGRPPLQGFVLGSSTTSKSAQRYPGPDIPSGYQPKRHEFGKGEYPGAWQDESYKEKQDRMERRRRKVEEERPTRVAKVQKDRESGPMAGAAFAGLAAAMKNRFTPSAPIEASNEEGPTAIGLQQPKSRAGAVSDASTVPAQAAERLNASASKPITIQRSTMTFVPESLLCKRFHVTPPAHATSTAGVKKTFEPSAEAAYFEREILPSVGTTSGAKSSEEKNRGGGAVENSSLAQQLLLEHDQDKEERIDNRPSMKVLESIFEPESEESSESEEEVDHGEASATVSHDQVSGHFPIQGPAAIPPGIPDGVLAPNTAETSVEVPPDSMTRKDDELLLDDIRKQKRRRHRDDSDRKRRKRTSRSHSPASTSSDRSRRKRSRKRDERKKQKKRHKSRRKSDSS